MSIIIIIMIKWDNYLWEVADVKLTLEEVFGCIFVLFERELGESGGEV